VNIAISFPGCYRRGGVERVVLETVNHLSDAGHEVHLFVSEWDRDAIDTRSAVHPVSYASRMPLARIRRFPQRCEQVMRSTGLDFDAHGAFGVMSPPGGTIWVGSVHAAWLAISRAQRDLRGRLRQMVNPYHHYILKLERHIFGGGRYRQLIALTDQVKQDLIDHYRVPSEDIAILGNGYSHSEFNLERRTNERQAVRAELGLSANQKVIVFVANETERKGFGPLVQAIAALDDPTVALIAVGKLDAARYRPRLAQLGLTDRVRFTGPSSDVGRYYAAADVFALPTQYEAWGLVIVEAMACGLPALTSRLAGAAIAVGEGETGELLDNPRDVGEITNKLSPLLEGRHANIESISHSVSRFRWSNVLRVYESLLVQGLNVPHGL
jgi:UDP-glucose:(heptosyl)LPS alpha-1,3-glucosyltransferase